MGAWVQDIYRRADIRDAGGVTPSTVVIELTDRCNLSCPGCYAKSTRDGCDISFDRLVDIVEQVTDMGVTLITVSGGPFVRWGGVVGVVCPPRPAQIFTHRIASAGVAPGSSRSRSRVTFSVPSALKAKVPSRTHCPEFRSWSTVTVSVAPPA